MRRAIDSKPDRKPPIDPAVEPSTAGTGRESPPDAHPQLRVRIFFVVATCAGLLGFVFTPWLQQKLGIFDFGRWFLDSYAVLAASDAVRAGIDLNSSNPLDVFGRPHSYSDWWHVLGRLGLSRDDNFAVGGAWVAGFLLVVWLTLRPRELREALLYLALILSPPVLLAIVRANNDLVVFALLGLAAIALRTPSTGRLFAALIAVGLATGLKFYPVVAAFVFLLVRPVRRMSVTVAVAATALLLVLANIWPSLGRGVFTLPQALYTFGGPVLFRDLGWAGPAGLVAGPGIVALAAGWLVCSGRTSGLADSAPPAERRVLFALGAATLVGCFVAGVSYAYRWIFALWLAPWLWDSARDLTASRPRRRLALLTLGLLLVLLWLDGAFCFVLNVSVGPMAEVTLDRLQLGWRLLTQPLAWVLIALLAGWLLDAARSTWREFRRLDPAPARPAAPR